ncbi:hypothetical protein [Nostoc sp.]|uniref:hypothetical protein n=1 Tax=Nostoc sp. TaxID=1180 RepID=UPI002FFBEEAA
MNRPISVRIIHQLEEKLQARLIALLHGNQPDLYLGRIWADSWEVCYSTINCFFLYPEKIVY